jgi:hypothetical protein
MDEREPLAADEHVYRRVHPHFFDASQPIPVKALAFRPSEDDRTGLSVWRALCAGPKETLPPDPDKAKAYYVVRLAIQDLARLGLTVQPEPLPGGPPGHCVIPELSRPAYEAQKEQVKSILVDLAKLASRDIVLRPV